MSHWQPPQSGKCTEHDSRTVKVVIKVIKAQNEKTFRRDVNRMRRWLRSSSSYAEAQKVGNPVALLNHVADYTTRELDLRNEIKGAEEHRESKRR